MVLMILQAMFLLAMLLLAAAVLSWGMTGLVELLTKPSSPPPPTPERPIPLRLQELYRQPPGRTTSPRRGGKTQS